ncbi:unnamed protein product [Urochloa decumbens]|uniref:Pectinesterase inhibitor domain-containing protein n=1 Tax=Urochloa decumbens TaxID=240449 RepID=A0ABC9D2Y7_9POAL
MKLLQATAPLIFLLACSMPSDASVVDDVCHTLTNPRYKRPVVSYDYCVAFFQADKGSATADQLGLAAIGARMIAATAKSTVKRIADLRAHEGSKDRLDCLSKCSKVYSGAVDEIGKAAKGIASGTGEALGDAGTSLATALDAPSTCEEGFQKIHEPSPLEAEDAKFRKDVSITLFATGTLNITMSV